MSNGDVIAPTHLALLSNISSMSLLVVVTIASHSCLDDDEDENCIL